MNLYGARFSPRTGLRGLRHGGIGLVVALLASSTARADVILEAESGVLTGTSTSTEAPGYSGTGYVTSFDQTGDKVSWSFASSGGLHQMLIRYRSQFGQKGFTATLNGVGTDAMFVQSTTFATFDAGLVELLPGGNTLDIGGGWNWYEIDRVDFVAIAPPTPPAPVPATLVDTQATFATRMLFQALVNDYGKVTWSGQHETTDVNYVQSVAARKPLIVSGDFMEYSPSRIQYGANPGNYTENMIALQNAGHVQAFCWHWNAPTNLVNTTNQPWWRGFYTEATTFDVAAALANTNSVEYSLILRDIDAIAVQLKKLSSNNIPVLWRPLHESEGGWFWWGAKGSGPFKQLWRLLFNRLTGNHSLHNLIWVLTSSDPDWYPGDDVVDVVGVDAYPSDMSDALSPQWEALKARFDGQKLLALTEFGGVPDIERMHDFGVWWAWFAPWGGSYGPSASPTNVTIRIYQSPEVITLDEMNAVPPQFVLSATATNGAPFFLGTGPRGAGYRVVTSTNVALPLGSWSQVSTGKFAGGVFTLTGSQWTNDPARFYRVVTP